MKSLFIVNDPPYGTERVYNALRLAHALTDHIATAIGCAQLSYSSMSACSLAFSRAPLDRLFLSTA